METKKTNNEPEKPMKLVTIMTGIHNVQVSIEAERVGELIKAVDDVRNGVSMDNAVGDFLDVAAVSAGRKSEDGNAAWIDVTDVSLMLVSSPPKPGSGLALPSNKLSVPNVVPPRGINLMRGGRG